MRLSGQCADHTRSRSPRLPSAHLRRNSMSSHLIGRRSGVRGIAMLALTLVGCAESSTSSGIEVPELNAGATGAVAAGEPNAAAGDAKAFIGAWLDGEAVRLRCTRSYFCAGPPSSVAASGCEIGA